MPIEPGLKKQTLGITGATLESGPKPPVISQDPHPDAAVYINPAYLLQLFGPSDWEKPEPGITDDLGQSELVCWEVWKGSQVLAWEFKGIAEQIRSNGRLSSLGQTEQIQNEAQKFYVKLGALEKRLSYQKGRLANLVKSSRGPAPKAEEALRLQLRGQEIRAHLSTLEPMDAWQCIVDATTAGDLEVLQAVVDAPAPYIRTWDLNRGPVLAEAKATYEALTVDPEIRPQVIALEAWIERASNAWVIATRAVQAEAGQTPENRLSREQVSPLEATEFIQKHGMPAFQAWQRTGVLPALPQIADSSTSPAFKQA